MKETLEQIKAECRKALELSEKATPGPWSVSENCVKTNDLITSPECETSRGYVLWAAKTNSRNREDFDLISHSRTFTPFAAQAMLTMIEGLEGVAFIKEIVRDESYVGTIAHTRLVLICKQWDDTK